MENGVENGVEHGVEDGVHDGVKRGAARPARRPADVAAIKGHVIMAIERYQLQRSRRLSLAGLGLEEVPEALYGLEDVEVIDLSGNLLRSIPERLSMLPSLRRILVYDNPMESFTDGAPLAVDARTYVRCRATNDVGCLEVLVNQDSALEDCDELIADLAGGSGPRKLILGSDTLGTVRAPAEPPVPSAAVDRMLRSLHRFTALESLAIRKLRLGTLPEGVRALRSLRQLHANDLQLSCVPAWLGELPLAYLSLSNNGIADLPAGMQRLNKLLTLDLSRNLLPRIPAVVFRLKCLASLMVYACPLREIPAEIMQLERLQSLAVDGGRILSPPPEVATKGLAAIRDYWRQRGDAGVDYLCEAKLIIVGEPGAGKTSLARKIVDPACALSPSEPSTEGIDVFRHEFPTVIRPREEGATGILQRAFQVNIWDFGGQEIYHATHQFFLTRRSVYVLVCDDRKEDTDFAYWLTIVDLLSDGSPLIIVENEKQDRTRDIDLGTLRARFGNLRGALRTNLESGRGLDAVIREIERALESLPHVGAGLPATWKRVREALEMDTRDHIGVEEYLRICERHGFSARNDSLQLSGYLHDLGICLHFQDDPVLRHTVILKPSWGTDAVYRVLDDPDVIRQRGQFTVEQARRIWCEPTYQGMQHELLQLMTRFQLCYALDDGRAYIAPQLLSPQKPEYPWPAGPAIVVRYEYTFLPKGIITRFIAGQHRLIADGIAWKTGVVLERDGTRAEVIEEYGRRRIRVRVTGPNRQGLLAIVDEQLERLHGCFHGLCVERFLPCPCATCAAQPEPFGFPLASLLNAVLLRSAIQCHKSMQLVDAAALVRDILPGALPLETGCVPPAPAAAPAAGMAAAAPEIFVSYAWHPDSQALVDRLQQALAGHALHLTRDTNTIDYRASIREFMRRLGRGNAIVVIVSDSYLRSENCMFELLEIEKAAGLRERVFPIVLPDAPIHKALPRAKYIAYWETQKKDLEDALTQLQRQHLPDMYEALGLYTDIRNMFDRIMATLRDMNALTPQLHEQGDFDVLIGQLKARMGL